MVDSLVSQDLERDTILVSWHDLESMNLVRLSKVSNQGLAATATATGHNTDNNSEKEDSKEALFADFPDVLTTNTFEIIVIEEKLKGIKHIKAWLPGKRHWQLLASTQEANLGQPDSVNLTRSQN